jgi:hypothetical protein
MEEKKQHRLTASHGEIKVLKWNRGWVLENVCCDHRGTHRTNQRWTCSMATQQIRKGRNMAFGWNYLFLPRSR